MEQENLGVLAGLPVTHSSTAQCWVGRAREMAILEAALAASCGGQGQLILLEGEPGIGKTRLLQELAASAGDRGMQVLWGRCYEGEGAPPFWPWIQILRRYLTVSTPETLQAEIGAGAAALALVIPEIRQRLADLPSLPALEPAQERFRFFDSLTTFLQNAARGRPLILIFDDLQWADTPSLLLLQFVAREVPAIPLYLIGTYRDLALDPYHPLTHACAELARIPTQQCLRLQGLSHHEVAHFLALTTGVTPAEPVVTSLHQRTEGNPFFLTEMVRLLMSEDGAAAFCTPQAESRLALPQSVREAIGRRVRPLPPPCQHLLRLASVMGRTFDVETLARVTGRAHVQLVQTLDNAVAAQIITPILLAAGQYRFAHMLFRDTLYADLPAEQRLRGHRQIGEALEARWGCQDALEHGLPSDAIAVAGTESILAVLAWHFFEAMGSNNEGGKALRYAVQAGVHATAMLAHEEAALHYQRALQSLLYTQPRDAAQQCELLLALGSAQMKAGDVPQARSTFLQAARVAQSAEAPALLTRAALGFEKIGVEVGKVDQALVTLLEDTLHVLGEADSAERTRILARLTLELSYAGTSTARRATLSQHAVAMARRIGDPTALAAALHTRLLDLWGPGALQERLATTTEMIQLAEATGDRERHMRGRVERLADLLELGEMRVVDLELAAYLSLAQTLRQPRYLWYGQLMCTTRALMEGQFAEGERLAQQALHLGQRVQPETAVHYLSVQLFWLYREQGRLQALLPSVQRLVTQYPAVPAWRSALATMYCDLGQAEAARSEFVRLAAQDFRDLPYTNSWLMSIALLAEVCAFLSDRSHAVTLYDLLLPYATHNAVIGGDAVGCYGAVARLLGLLATTLQRWEPAVQHFEAALRMHQRMGARPFVARTQYAYAAMLVARNAPGDAAQAQALLAMARTTAEELQMQGLMPHLLEMHSRIPPVLRLDDVPGVVHANASPPRRTAGITPEPGLASQPAENIFRKEGDYWTLAYQGRTCHLKDTRGLRAIAVLLHTPGQEQHVLDILAVLGESQRPARRQERGVGTPGGTQQGSLGATLDTAAKMAYKRRLLDLHATLAEAQRCHDLARAAQAQAEIDWLSSELAAAFGLGGRDRQVGADAERARSTITKAIKAAVHKIRQHHPPLGHHLAIHLKTGLFCQYRLAPGQPTCWTL
jgi:tetratricopeptide (TPR) repeat protein